MSFLFPFTTFFISVLYFLTEECKHNTVAPLKFKFLHFKNNKLLHTVLPRGNVNVDLDNNISMMIGLNEASFFTSSNFNSTINNLLTNFDQVFVCSSKNNASVGLLAFQEFDFSLVLSAGLRTTQKLAIRKIKENKPIDLLFYD